MKVAFATQDLKRVDAHFGWAPYLAIYEMNTESYQLVDTVQFATDLAEDGNEDKLAPKVEAIADCAIVYVGAIGGSAAARVVAKKIHPIKVPEPKPIAELLEQLRVALNGNPPPWLRKALLKGQERSFDFAED